MKDKKINISEETARKLELVCFFNQISRKRFIEKLIDGYLQQNPLPKQLKLTKDFSYKVIK